MRLLTFEFTGYGRVHRPEAAWNDGFGVVAENMAPYHQRRLLRGQDMQITVERREMSDYPKRDLTPEHTKRRNGHDTFSDAPTHPDVTAAYAYVDGVIDLADIAAGNSPAWHGWALREAFLAGVSHAENKTPNAIAQGREHSERPTGAEG